MINQIKDLIVTDTGKDTAVVFTGTIINAAVGGIFFIIAPRILGPADFGLFAVVSSTGILLASLANFGIDTGILKFVNYANKLQSARILKLALSSYLVIGISLAIFGLLISPPLAAFLGYKQLAPLLRIAFAGTLLILLTDFFVAALQTKREFLKASLVNISSNIVRLLILLLAAYFFVINLYFLTILFFAVILISVLIGKIFVPLNFLDAKNYHKEFGNFFGFNFWIAASIVISTIPFDNYLLVKIVGATATGIYAAPYKLISIVDQLAGNFSRVLASRFSSFSNHQEAKIYALKTIPIILVLFGGIALGSVIAGPLVNLLLGDQYQESVKVFRILSLGFAFYFTNTTAVSLIIYYLGKSKETFLITLAVKLFLLFSSIILIMKFKELGAATAFLVSAIISTVLFNLYAVWQLKKANNGQH